MTGLQKLYLDDSEITNTGLAHLEKLTGLQSLSIDNSNVTDTGLAELRKALPNCHIYHLSGP
jgi:Leucine-rich repeat (LRR) protein